MQNSIKNHQAAFTLTELMIVVAIIAILSAVAVPAYMKYVRSARTAEATSNLAAIQSFEESYFSDNDTYVTTLANPTTFPKGGSRQPFIFGTAGWTSLGNVIPANRQLYFQYQITAGFRDAGNNPFTLSSAGASAAGSLITHAPAAGSCGTSIGNTTFAGVDVYAVLGAPQTANTFWFVATAIGDQDGNGRCSLFVALTDRPDITEEERIQ